MSLYKLRDLKVKLQRNDRPLNLVYEWVKTEHINRQEFIVLITYCTEVLKA